MKGRYVEISVYLSCVTFVLNFYASFITLLAFLAHFIIFVLLSCVFFLILWKYRIPKPADSTFRSIFGADWGAYAENDDKKIDKDFVMKVVAHRACGLDAPENSLAALSNIFKEGITAVEFDVLVTADDIPIIFHDNCLRRMTNVNKTVDSLTYEEIKGLDISVSHPFRKNFPQERIPTLDEYVTYCLERNIRMFIDIKVVRNYQKIVLIICDLFKQYPKMYELSVVSSFNPILIYRIRHIDPKITCSLAWRPYFYSHEEYSSEMGPIGPRTNKLHHLLFLRVLNIIHEWALWRFGYYVLGLSAILFHKDMITKEMVKFWRKRGIRVIAWSVNLPTEKQYFEKILEITYLTDTVINS